MYTPEINARFREVPLEVKPVTDESRKVLSIVPCIYTVCVLSLFGNFSARPSSTYAEASDRIGHHYSRRRIEQNRETFSTTPTGKRTEFQCTALCYCRFCFFFFFRVTYTVIEKLGREVRVGSRLFLPFVRRVFLQTTRKPNNTRLL